MAYRTLGELRGILLARLGMGGMGASGGANQALMDSFLSNGQTQLYWETDWRHLTKYEDKTIGYGQNLLDYPAACVRDRRILRIETPYNGQWRKVPEGIVTEMWSTMETLSYPKRYERFEQLLIYPKADQIYTIRFWFIKDRMPFSETNDVATLDDEMILLHALANAKAHYRQPDAQIYQGQLNSLLGHIRGQSFGSSGSYKRTKPGEAERKPLVIGRDVP